MSTVVALILWFAVTCYAVLGGADYGAGFWDLTAGGAKRGARPRALIDHAMAPVWEANNVWLIFALVVLWTAFPPAFASIMSTLFVPMSLAAAGIVLRGSGFVFHKAIRALTGRRLFGAVFALSSILTPFFLGASFGAIASGQESRAAHWIGPTSILIGVLAVPCAAFLAAVFLVVDARRALDEALERYFRRRAIGSGVVTGLIAVVGLFVLRGDAPLVFHGLVREGLPFVIISGLCGVATIVAARPADHPRHPRARGRRGGGAARRLGRRPVPVPAAELADDRRRGRRPAHAGLAPRRVPDRRRDGRAVAGAAVRSRPAQPIARRRRRPRTGAGAAATGSSSWAAASGVCSRRARSAGHRSTSPSSIASPITCSSRCSIRSRQGFCPKAISPRRCATSSGTRGTRRCCSRR